MIDTVERFNARTHLIGTLMAPIGGVLLIRVAIEQGDGWKLFSFSLYAVCLFLLYLGSTLNHSVGGRWGEYFQRVDHCNIYLLIAGSYTPYALVTLREGPGWWLFAAVWALAAIGIVQDLIIKHEPRVIPVVLYLLMGWLVLTVIKPLTERLDPEGFNLLLASGIVYTLGVPFFGLSRYRPRLHGIWHLMVMGGSLLHFLSVFFYVAPPS